MREEHSGRAMILADWQTPWVLPVAASAAIFAAGLVSFLARRLAWYSDEWGVITRLPSWTVRDYLIPRSDGWSTIPYVVYDVLLHTAGLRSYVPYVAVLALLLGANGYLLFLLLKPRAGSAVAFGAALILLFLGRGWTDMFWAWQIGFVGSCTFGLGALVLIDREEVGLRRMAACSALLILGLMCSNIGLLFLAALAISLAVHRDRWQHLLVAVPPVAVYLVWWALFGRHGIGPASPGHVSPAAVLGQYLPASAGAAVAAMFGLSAAWAPLALAAMAAALAVHWSWHRRVDPLVLAVAVAAVLLFSLGDLTRGDLGPIDASPYLYVGALLLLIVVADIVSHIPTPKLLRPAVALIFLCILACNVEQMETGRNHQKALVAGESVQLQTAWAMRDAPGFDAQMPVGVAGISAAAYDSARQRFGSPYSTLAPDQLATLPSAEVNATLIRIFPDSARKSGLADFPRGARCQLAEGPNGLNFTLNQPRQQISFSAPYPTAVRVYLWHLGLQPPPAIARVFLLPGQQFTVPVPDAGSGFIWHVRLVGQPDSELSACAF